jgi:hypothetical protein
MITSLIASARSAANGTAPKSVFRLITDIAVASLNYLLRSHIHQHDTSITTPCCTYNASTHHTSTPVNDHQRTPAPAYHQHTNSIEQCYRQGKHKLPAHYAGVEAEYKKATISGAVAMPASSISNKGINKGLCGCSNVH